MVLLSFGWLQAKCRIKALTFVEYNLLEFKDRKLQELFCLLNIRQTQKASA